MKLFPRSIKSQVTLVTVLFTLAVDVLLASIGFYLYQSFLKQNEVRASEFNLELVASPVSQNIVSLNLLSQWCSYDSNMIAWLQEPSVSDKEQVSIYDLLKEQMQNNRANTYIRRLIVFDAARTRMLQITNLTGRGSPVNPGELDSLVGMKDTSLQSWSVLTRDPYDDSTSDASIIPVWKTINVPGTGDVLGYVYMSVGAELFTDPYADTQQTSDSRLYLDLPSGNYQLKGSRFVAVPSTLVVSKSPSSARVLGKTASVYDVRLRDRTSGLLVRYPVAHSTAVLSQFLSEQSLAQPRLVFGVQVLAICIGILALGSFIAVWLNHLITSPVARLRGHLREISKGNFTADPGVEWDNELGEVGRGINQMSREMVSLIQRRLDDQKEKQELEYRMLQSQVNPHFIYNALNSIKWMATIQGAKGIAEMTTALSRLLREIAKGTRQLVPLRDELALLDDYILIQQYRYGNAITVKKDIAEGLEDNQIAKFTLQPLVENAIAHGIEPKGGKGTISISARPVGDDRIEVAVQDDGVGMDADAIRELLQREQPAQAGMFQKIGVYNVNKRIRLSFGETYGLSITSEPGRYTRISIFLPRRSGDRRNGA